jgi:hypothetical protein
MHIYQEHSGAVSLSSSIKYGIKLWIIGAMCEVGRHLFTSELVSVRAIMAYERSLNYANNFLTCIDSEM